jgi:hypothetical protein
VNVHHENARSQTALPVKQISAKMSIMILEHPTYSPDLAPSDVFLFCIIKNNLKWPHFEIVEEIQDVTTAALYNLQENDWLLGVLRQLERTLECCRRELLWQRPLQFKLKFNILLPVSAVSLFNCHTS